MSEHTSSVKYKVSVEGAEGSIDDLQEVIGQTGSAIRMVTSLDYAFISWQRTAQQFSITNFASSVLSTINLIQTLIRVTQSAEAAQTAYNIALAIGRALQGPYGWAILAGGFVAGAGIAHLAGSTPAAATTPLTAEEARRREAYRAVVPG